jgi:hypothetical protein
MKQIGLILAAILSVAACRTGEPCGLPTATRCSGNAAEICSGGSEWVPTLDCDAITEQSDAGPWVCCAGSVEGASAPVHTCVPKNDCVNGVIQ